MIARWFLCLWVGLAAASCAQSRRVVPMPPAHDAAVSGDAAPPAAADAGLSENRVPDAGAPPAQGYRIQGSLSVQPAGSAPNYQLHDQRFEMRDARCGQVGAQTLCVSGSLSNLR